MSTTTTPVEQETERFRQVVIASKSNPDVLAQAEKCMAKLNALFKADPSQFSEEDIRWVNVLRGQLAVRLAEHTKSKATHTPLAKRKGDSLDHCWRCKIKIDERFVIHPDCDSKAYHWRTCPVCDACGCQRNGTKLV